MKKIIVLLLLLCSQNLFAQTEKAWIPDFMKATEGMTSIIPRNENEEKLLFLGMTLAFTDSRNGLSEDMVKEFGEERVVERISKIIELEYSSNKEVYDIIFDGGQTNDSRMEKKLKDLNLSTEKKRKVDKLYALVFQESLYGFSETTSFLKSFDEISSNDIKLNRAFNMYWNFFQGTQLKRDELSYMVLSFLFTQTYLER